MFVSLKILLTASLTALIPSCSAWAQSDAPRSPTRTDPVAAPKAYPIRVDSSMAVIVPVPVGASPEEQLKLTESTRVSLYQAAAAECGNLMRLFKYECRLQNIRMNSAAQGRNSPGDTIHVSVSSGYELTYRPN